MIETLKNAFKVPDLRKKLLYTLMVILVYRLGSAIPVPFLDAEVLKNMMTTSGTLFGYIDVMTGGAFSKATLFAMGVTPYVNATIIIQLLTVAIPALERMAKEGEDGRKRLNRITRYCAVIMALLQAFAYLWLNKSYGSFTMTGWTGFFAGTIIVLVFTAGTALIMWFGEQINDKGIGNGISLLIFANILSRGPSMMSSIVSYWQLGGTYYALVPFMIVLFLAVVAFIVFMNDAERKISVLYAKRVVGRKMMGGQSTHIPIKVNMTGVMPIIFASSILSVPATIGGFINPAADSTFGKIVSFFNYNGWAYAILYFILIIFFNFFYAAIQYNPIEISNNLRKNSGMVPGLRPGKPTSDYIAKVISKVCLVGALFVAAVAVLPIVINKISSYMGAGMSGLALGGTTILILVGVALDTSRQLESQMMMRHYKGFLE